MSRPLIALLVATVAFFALWLVALKPSSGSNGTAPTITTAKNGASSISNGSGGQSSLGAYGNDINAAKNVQKVVNGNTARQSAAEAGSPTTGTGAGSTPATSTQAKSTTPASSSAAATSTAKAHHATRHAQVARATHRTHARHTVTNPGVSDTPAARLGTVERAFAQRKVVALLFYNPSGADDQAVKQELATIPTHGGQVAKLAIPISELPSYAELTSQNPVNFTPTLLVINRQHQAFELTGFADTYAISALITGAL